MSDSSWRVTVRDTILIIVGCLLFAIGADCFEIPYGLAAGGVTGLATVIHDGRQEGRDARLIW